MSDSQQKIDYIIKIGNEYFLKWEKNQLFTVRLRNESKKFDAIECAQIVRDLKMEGFSYEVEEYEIHRVKRKPRKKKSVD